MANKWIFKNIDWIFKKLFYKVQTIIEIDFESNAYFSHYIS